MGEITQKSQLSDILFEHSRDGLLVVDFSGRVCQANPRACTLLGAGLEGLLGAQIEELALAGPDGALNVRRVAGTEGEVYFLAPRSDLPELERLKTVVENLNEGLIFADASSNVFYWNRAAIELHGFPSSEECYRTLPEFEEIYELRELGGRVLSLDDWPMARLLRGEKVHRLDLELRRRDQDWQRCFRYSGNHVLSETGRSYVFLTLSDISGQVHIERQLRRERERFEKLVLTVPGVVHTFKEDPDGHVSFPFASPAIEDIYGLTPAQLKEDGAVVSLWHPEDVDRILTTVAASREKWTAWHQEFRVIHPDRGVVWVEGHSLPRKGPDGSVIWSGVLLDVTERKLSEAKQRQLEAQLRHAQKMESVGRLAGGVAHDFNNFLTVIQMYSELLLADGSFTGLNREGLQEIRKAGERAAALTRQLLMFSRRQLIEPRVLDANQLLADLERMLSRLIGENIAVEIELAEELWPVEVDAGGLEQAVVNLIVNARDAMPQGGCLRLQTRNVPGCPDGIEIVITDDGEGMEAATQARIFEPFFTTKAQGQGTGLGLSTVYGVVQQASGRVTVESRVGEGASFTIWLPASASRPEPATGQAEAPSDTGAETILVVEDDDAVRHLLELMLGRLGYKVLLAYDGVHALELAEQYPATIHLLLTDLVMPRLGGRHLAERLVQQRPDLRVLFMSGYTDDEVIRVGMLESDVDLVVKPFRAGELASRVRRMLDQPSVTSW
ncbi:MAG: ATP-binding protein [Vulcanimicrobiota bacterium]